MTDYRDRSKSVRPGEELDVDKLSAYLDRHLDSPDNDATSAPTPLVIEQFPSGHSNLTYLIRRGEQAYVLRRPPYGSKVKSAHDMQREYRILSHLAPVYAKAPRPVLLCDDHSVLGADFYLMERIHGVIMRKDPPKDLHLDPERAHTLSRLFVDTLAELHAIDYRACGLGDFGKPVGYVQRQVEGWTKRYYNAQTDEIADMEAVIAWLAQNRPEDQAPCLIHNDFKFDNLVLHPDDMGSVIGILDWEMSTVGDPLMDLGTALSYWIQSDDPQLLHEIRFGPTHVPGMMTRAELAAYYAEQSGRDIRHLVFYYTFGLFKTAVVAQQIYARFHRGLTKDQRFAMMIVGVKALVAKARQAIESGRV